MNVRWFVLLGLTISLGSVGASPLSLTNLLQSVDSHYPAVIAALKEKEAAEGEALSAKGAFDLRLKFNSRNDPLGFYENRILEALIEQPTPYRGTRFFGGWRRGNGLFPLQEEKRETQSGGEVLFGMAAPLLRDNAIDSARAGIQRTELGVESEQARLESIRLLVQQSATAQLLKWHAAAQKRVVYQSLLDLALVRDRGIRDQVAIGDKAEVDIIDNQRLIATRRETVIAARQTENAEAVRLSLYWRGTNGRPQIPVATTNDNRLKLTLLGDKPSLGEALAKHPNVRVFDRLLQAERVTRRLARNQLLPQLDLSLSVSKDLGIGSRTKQETEFRVGAFFEYPFQNRRARGNLQSTQAKIVAMEQKLGLVTDQLRASALVAENNMDRISERLAQLQERLDRAKQMRKAETDRVNLKLSDLLRLNLREQDVTAAETDLIDAQLELRLAELDWINSLAIDLAPEDKS